MSIASWGTPDRVPFLGVPVRTALGHVGADRRHRPARPGPLSRPTPEALGGLLQGGGFSDVEVEEAEVSFTFQSADEFTVFIREIAPPISAIFASSPQDVQEAGWDAITAAMAEQAGSDGTLTTKNQVLIATGSVAAISKGSDPLRSVPARVLDADHAHGRAARHSRLEGQLVRGQLRAHAPFLPVALLHAEHGHSRAHPPRQGEQRLSLPGSG